MNLLHWLEFTLGRVGLGMKCTKREYLSTGSNRQKTEVIARMNKLNV